MFIKNILKFIKDIIAPKKCYSCNKEWHFLCEDCFSKIEKHYYFDQICYVCKKYSPNFEVHEKCKNPLAPLSGGIECLSSLDKGSWGVFYDKTIILTHYKIKVIKKLIKDFKFYYKKEISNDFSEYLTEKMIKYMKEELKYYRKQDFIVIYSPMSFFRKMIRWYNHSEILARKIASNFWFKFENKLIMKKKQTRQQSKLSRQERLKNLKNAFKINKNKVDIIDKKIVILVDDVISTWTTVNEISKILKQYNAKKIIVVAIASWY